MTLVQTTAEKIKTKVDWAITVRPADFDEVRIPSQSSLFPLVYDAAVSIHGRMIPAVDASDFDEQSHFTTQGSDWVQSSSDWNANLQSWRIYQSGQFVLLLAVRTDWVENPVLRQVPYPEGKTFPLWDSMATFVAIYEFAARLSSTIAGSSEMVVTTSIRNIQGAQLVQDNLRKTSLRHYVFPEQSYEYPSGKATPIAREALLANPRQFAAEAGNDLLHHFGFKSTVDSVALWQSEF
ncbi:MAG: hypothetical protein E6R14_08405 [Thermomicrobiales bacterium]|nr:MAG: hypothetical protein E6R14_08405 [Thermomicrobiales bacterium]